MKITHALVVKLVDTKDLKLAACGVPVRVWPRAPLNEQTSDNFRYKFKTLKIKYY